ncbi:MAG: hypothetical protein EZS28_050825, partial [Streblomastix strix]
MQIQVSELQQGLMAQSAERVAVNHKVGETMKKLFPDGTQSLSSALDQKRPKQEKRLSVANQLVSMIDEVSSDYT